MSKPKMTKPAAKKDEVPTIHMSEATVEDSMSDVEAWLNKYFGEDCPVKLSAAGRKIVVRFAPVVALALGVLGLLFVYNFWRNGHNISRNAQEYLGITSGVSYLGTMWYVLAILLLVRSGLLLMALKGLMNKSKFGWDMAFYAALVNCLVGVSYLFVSGYGFANFFMATFWSVIGLFLLFQTRHKFLGR